MNSIEKRKTHLKHDENARFKDLFIDGSPFQEYLRQRFPKEFSRGRYREEFVPRLFSNVGDQSIPLNARSNSFIAPVYGCLDGCCAYLFAEIEYSESQVKWLRIAQDSSYLGTDKSEEQEPLLWLKGFQNLIFDKKDYDQVFS